MAYLAPQIKRQFFNSNGDPLVGGKVYTYLAGTSTPRATYTDNTEATENTNPIILDANGECAIWIGTSSYKFVVTDSDDVVLKTEDNVSLPSGAASGLPIGGTANQLLKKDSSTDYNASWAGPLNAATFGSTPNAKGLTVDAATMSINLEPADGTNPGSLSAGTQTIGGAKTFSGALVASSTLGVTGVLTAGGNIIAEALVRGNHTVDNTTTGSGASFTATRLLHILTDASLASINNIASPADSQLLILINSTGVDLVITNDSGGTAANRIKTGTGDDLDLLNGAALWLAYDPNATRWQVIGGSGAGGGGGALIVSATQSLADAAAITLTADTQRERVKIQSTGGIATVTLPNGTIDGQEVFVQGESNDDYCVIINGGNVVSNGDSEFYDKISYHFIWDDTDSVWIRQGN